MIAEIFVPHPHGGHAIPIAERQILTLREKIHELETRLRDLMRFGSENEATGEKMHRVDARAVRVRPISRRRSRSSTTA